MIGVQLKQGMPAPAGTDSFKHSHPFVTNMSEATKIVLATVGIAGALSVALVAVSLGI